MSDIALNSGFQDILSAVRTLTEAVKPHAAIFEEISRARALLRYSSYIARKHTSGLFLGELKAQGELQDFAKEIERLTDILIASARDLEERARKRPLFYLPIVYLSDRSSPGSWTSSTISRPSPRRR